MSLHALKLKIAFWRLSKTLKLTNDSLATNFKDHRKTLSLPLIIKIALHCYIMHGHFCSPHYFAKKGLLVLKFVSLGELTSEKCSMSPAAKASRKCRTLFHSL